LNIIISSAALTRSCQAGLKLRQPD